MFGFVAGDFVVGISVVEWVSRVELLRSRRYELNIAIRYVV